MLGELRSAAQARRAHRHVQPAARARAGTLRRSASARGHARRWRLHADRTHYFQPRIGGDLAVVTGTVEDCVIEARAAVDHGFIGANTAAGYRDVRRRALRAVAWAGYRARIGPVASADRTRPRRSTSTATRTIVCWGMGITQHHAAVAHDPDADQPAVAARQHRQARRRPVPGARPFATCRATARWASTRSRPRHSSTGWRQVFGFSPPRAARLRHGRSDRGHARRQATVFFAMGGNFAAATPDTAKTHAGAAALRADRARHAPSSIARTWCTDATR